MRESRRLALALLVLVLVLAGCASRLPRPGGVSATGEVHQGPLAARILPPFHRTLRFELSEPAYVTVFEIVPGRGVSIVYPATYDYRQGRPLPAGSISVFAAPYNVGRWYYSDLPVAASGPTFLYMIASREPLRIRDVLSEPASLRRVVGFANFTRSNEQRTMDALDERFVPGYLDGEAWTSDWLALWPEPALDHSQIELRHPLPRCEDGRVLVAVPGPTIAYACAPREATAPTPKSPTDSSARPGPPTPTPVPATPPQDEQSTTPPAGGQRKPAPKRLRREPLSLVVDYGSPNEAAGAPAAGAPAAGAGFEARQRAWQASARPWERGRGDQSTLDREAAMDRRDRSIRAEERRSDGFARGRLGGAVPTEHPERHDAGPRTAAPRAEPRTMEPRRDPTPASNAPAHRAGAERNQSTERSQ